MLTLRAKWLHVGALSFAVLTLTDVCAAERPLYVVNAAGNISTFAIQPDRSLVASGGTAMVGTFLRGIVIAPDGLHAYTVDSDAGTVLAFAIDHEGNLTAIGAPMATDPEATGPFPACLPEQSSGTGPCPWGLALAPDGRWLYVANFGSNTVSVFRVLRDGTLRPFGSPVPAGGLAPRGVAVSRDGERVYVSLRDSDTITVFAVAPSGQLRPLGEPVQIPGCTPPGGVAPSPQCAPFFIAIAPNGRWLYTTQQESGDLAVFAIGPDGTLTPIGDRVPVGGRTYGIAIPADGRVLYANSIDANAVFAFAIGEDGRLTPLGSFPTCDMEQTPAACQSISIAITPDAKAVYASNFLTSDVAQFSVGADGTLADIEPTPIASGGMAPTWQGLAVRPNQGPIASLARVRDASLAGVAFDASGSSDPDGEVVRFDWDFGDGEKAPDAGPTPVHVYAAPGRYRATVTVTDNEGCSDVLVFTGQTAMCTGSRAATASGAVMVEHQR